MNSSPMSAIWRLVRIEKKNIHYLYTYAIIAGLMSLTIPLGIQALIGAVMVGKLSSSWFILVTGITLLAAVAGLTRLAQLSILDSIQRKLFVRFSLHFAKKLFQKSKQDPTSLNLMSKSSRFLDIVTLQKSFSKLILDFTSKALQIIAGLALLAVYHSSFIILAIIIGIIIYIGFKLTWTKGFETARDESNYKFSTADTIQSISTNQEIQSESDIFKLLETHIDGYVGNRNAHFAILKKQALFAIITKVILTAAMLVIGSTLLIEQQISLGQFLAAEILIITLLDAVEKLILTVEYIYDCGIAIEKLEIFSKSKTLKELEV